MLASSKPKSMHTFGGLVFEKRMRIEIFCVSLQKITHISV